MKGFLMLLQLIATDITEFALSNEICTTDTCRDTAALVKSNIDPSVDPCVDFYQYACGGWSKKNPRPITMPIDEPLSRINDKVTLSLTGLLENDPLPEGPNATINVRKLYKSCLNDEMKEKEGVQSLIEVVQELGGWPLLGTDRWNQTGYVWYRHLVNVWHRVFMAPIINTYLIRDRPSIVVVSKPQFTFGRVAGIDSRNAKMRKRAFASCVWYIMKFARILGSTLDNDQLRESASRVVQFEMDLRKLNTNADQRVFTYIPALGNSTEGLTFSWYEYVNLIFKGINPVTAGTEFLLLGVDYIYKVPKLVENTDPRIVADYIGFAIVVSLAKYSTPELRQLFYNFNKVKFEAKSACTVETCYYMSSACTRLFIAQNFSDDIRRDVTEMVEMLRLAYRTTLENNSWMDNQTKEEALEKLTKMRVSIGYNDWILDNDLLDKYYESVGDFNENTFLENLVRLMTLNANEMLSLWGKKAPISVSNPLDANAYYFMFQNHMELTAAILRLPFYKYNRIDAVNYGSLGFLIGHEISHAFDTYRSKYDSEGKLRDWWTEATKQRYQEKVQCFIDQYSAQVEPMTKLKVNGNLTITENLADNGALSTAYKAFRLSQSLHDQGQNRHKRLVGVSHSPEQMFFLGFASAWCTNVSKSQARLLITTDVHSPNKVRVNVPASNFIEFARAFKCAPGTPMNPTDKCALW